MSYLGLAAYAWHVCAGIDWTFCFLFQNSNPSPWAGRTIWRNYPCFCVGFLCSCNSFIHVQDVHRFCPLKGCVTACRHRPNVLLKVVHRIFGQVGLVQCYKAPCVLASAVPRWSSTAVFWDFCALSKRQPQAKICSAVRQLCWLAKSCAEWTEAQKLIPTQLLAD